MGSAWRPGDIEPSPLEPSAGAPGRRKLWNLGPGQHCAVVGTCLSIEDLRRVVRKAGMTIAPEADDYSIHVHCVTACGQQGPLSRHLHKLLDKLFAGEIARVRAIKNPADLLAHWMACRAKGRIAPAFWALMTHPAADGPTIGEIYGDVHMMSHLNGYARIADLSRLDSLTQKLRDTEARLARTRTDMQESLARRDATIDELSRKLQAQASLAVQPAPQAQPSRRDDKAGRLIAVLQRKLSSERARARQAEARLEAMPEPALAEAVNETIRPETTEAAASVDLAGVTVLYVGGRPNQRAHLRAAVEHHHGAFLHHDGGIEQSLATLDGLVSQADTVVCAIDCISHGACLRIKAVCRRMGRNFMPLRSASASNLQRMLPALVDKNRAGMGQMRGASEGA
jgi:hypothetical protein